MNRFSTKSTSLFLASVVFLILMAGQLPFFLEYLNIPNKHLLSWDMALHAKDGILFYLQAKRLDLISFLYTLINLSFWMPLHPFLIALTSIFFPFNFDAYVFLNLIVFTSSVSAAVWIFSKTKRANLGQKILFALSIIWLCFRLQNSRSFWGTHYNIMLESLGVGLTILFLTSWMLEDESDPEYYYYSKISNITLSLLFFTKIQYGLFFGAAYFFKHLLYHRVDLISYWNQFKKEWLSKKWLVILSTLFVLGSFVELTILKNKADAICFLGFALVLIVTFTGKSRSTAPQTFQLFLNWVFIPFGWYYLFPIKNKVRHLLFNASTYVSKETLTEKLWALVSDFAVFFSINRYWALATILVSLMISFGVFRTKKTKIRIPFGSIFLAGLLFYLPMSLVVGARIDRFSATWVVLFPLILAFSLIELSRKKVILTFLILTLSAAIGYESHRQPLTQMSSQMRIYGFLDPENKSLQKVLDHFNFNQPGVIYGLGSTMDLSTILFDLLALKTHPEYSDVLLKREDRALALNDFGRDGNQNPSEIILNRAKNPDLKQIVLYPSGFKSEQFFLLRESLTQMGFLPKLDTKEVLFLYR